MALTIPLKVQASPQTLRLAVETPVEQIVTTDYERLTGLPQINGVTLLGDQSAAELGIAAASTEVSQNAPTAIALADNTVYYLSNVSALTLSYPSDAHWECLIVLTTAASGAVTVTLPASSYIGSAPSFGNSETWEISIRDGVVVAGKAEATS